MPAELSETRLLNLIKRRPKKKPDISKQKSFRPKSLPLIFFKDFLFRSRIVNRSFLKSSHRALRIILLLLLGYFALSFLFPLWRSINLSRPERPVPDNEAVETGSYIVKLQDYSAYLKQMQGKQLFETNFTKEKLQTKSEINISEKFSLVGIISGAHPQAIIEDKQAQKTYYLYQGQSFSGVMVKEIAEGKVILNYQGRQVELFL